MNGAQNKIVRVCEKAPHGTVIRRIGHPGDATNDVTGSRLLGAMIYGKDAAKFAIFEGHLVVDEYPELRGSVGDSFSVKLSLTSQDALRQVTSEVTLRIVVSNRNYIAPRQLALTYTAEVLRYSEPGPLVMARVQDDDVDAYNRETVFHLSPRSGFLEIGETDGVVRTRAGLHKAPSVIETEIVATNTGSPPLSSSKRLTVNVRDLSGRKWTESYRQIDGQTDRQTNNNNNSRNLRGQNNKQDFRPISPSSTTGLVIKIIQSWLFFYKSAIKVTNYFLSTFY